MPRGYCSVASSLGGQEDIDRLLISGDNDNGQWDKITKVPPFSLIIREAATGSLLSPGGPPKEDALPFSFTSHQPRRRDVIIRMSKLEEWRKNSASLLMSCQPIHRFTSVHAVSVFISSQVLCPVSLSVCQMKIMLLCRKLQPPAMITVRALCLSRLMCHHLIRQLSYRRPTTFTDPRDVC